MTDFDDLVQRWKEGKLSADDMVREVQTSFELYCQALIRQWEEGLRDAEDVVREIRTALDEERQIREAPPDPTAVLHYRALVDRGGKE